MLCTREFGQTNSLAPDGTYDYQTLQIPKEKEKNKEDGTGGKCAVCE